MIIYLKVLKLSESIIIINFKISTLYRSHNLVKSEIISTLMDLNLISVKIYWNNFSEMSLVCGFQTIIRPIEQLKEVYGGPSIDDIFHKTHSINAAYLKLENLITILFSTLCKIRKKIKIPSNR